MLSSSKSQSNPPLIFGHGFTIAELLIVIVIIGILAAITIIAYTGIQHKAVLASLQSDLTNAARQIKMYQVDNGIYPDSIADCPQCFKSSYGNEYTNLQTDSQSFSLTIKNNNTRYHIDNNSSPTLGSGIGVASGLMAYYSFDVNTIDISGNTRNGTNNGAILTSGALNMAYGFNSSATYINLPNDLGYSTQVSAFAWFKKLGAPGNNYHIIFGGQELEISIPTSGQIRTGVYTNARFVSNHGSGLVDGNWHFVGFTFDGSTKKSYIDGVNVGEQTVNSGTLTSSFSNRRIGVYGATTSYYTNGVIDEVRIYDRALSADEINILYTL